MSDAAPDDSEKSHEATPQKLLKARKKGEIAKSTDLSVAAGYGGLVLAAMAVGAQSITSFGTTLLALLDQPDRIAALVFDGPANGPIGGLMMASVRAIIPWFAIPAAAVLLSILAQRAFVVAPSKVKPKGSRISILANAKNKFGRSGLFEFAKSFSKLLLYSVSLSVFLSSRLPQIISVIGSDPRTAVALLARLSIEFMFLVLLIATGIGFLDAVWQHNEHLRKNRMSRKEIMDETKDAEGDPHVKQQRRQRAQEIAMTQMLSDVPDADVVIVNPTHFAVALKWNRSPGAAPVCVARGVDEIAAAIRKKAEEFGVPIHHDPPTARALHETVELGQEISEEHYRAVAAAIRFAEKMRVKARGRIL